jgi:hypothetical protein
MVRKSSQQAAVNGATAPPRILQGEERKEVLEQRRLFIDLQNQSSQSFDKMIVTLAGGALTLSIAFIRQTVPEIMPGTAAFLALAWLLLLLSLLAILISHFTSQFGMMKACEQLESDYLGVPQTQPTHRHLLGRAYGWFSRGLSRFSAHRMTTHFLNLAAIFLCVVGIGLLAWFVLLNFPQLQIPLRK